jgi:branched-chain amino acid transport system substrate-binding protein
LLAERDQSLPGTTRNRTDNEVAEELWMSDHRYAAPTPHRTTPIGEPRRAGLGSRGCRGRWRGLFRGVAVMAATATALAGCAAPGSSDGSSSGPLKIGMSLPLTGAVADVSKAGYQGYQLWAEQLNAGGGLLGRQVNLDVLDNGFDPNQAGSDYTRLISQNKVDLLLGTFSSLLNAPASAIAARQQMLYIEPSGGAASLFSRGFTNLFFAQPGTTETLPNRFVDWVSSLPADQRPKTAAYLTQDDPSASPAIQIFKTKLQALGVTQVYDQTYDPSTTNFDTIAAAVARTQPQMVIQGAVAGDGAQFVRSLEKLHFSPKVLYQTNAPTDESYPSAIGAGNAEGVFTTQAWNPKATYAGNAGFVSAYTQKFGGPPSEDAANSYTAGQVLAAAVKAVGRIDQKALADWLHANTVDTIVGPLKWDSTGVPEGDGLLAQWQKNTLEVIAPQSAATSNTIVNPKPGWSN